VRALAERLAATPWPGPPAGFLPLAPPRAMRSVFAGPLALPEGDVPVVVKWHRPVTWLDRIARRFTGGRGPREAELLAAVRAGGLPAPEPLGSAHEPVDLLVTRRLEGLVPLPEAGAAPRALVESVAHLLARLHAAGVVHRDLTRANLGLLSGRPVLVDLGGARLAETSGRARRLAHLAQVAHGFLHGASRATAARGLRAWLETLGEPKDAWRRWTGPVANVLAERVRRHHRRRERRPARAGRHFALFRSEGVLGVRREPEAPAAWERLVAGWIGADPARAAPLKADGSVLRADLPGREEACVLKRYAGVAPGRLARPVAAFRRAVALGERGLDVAPVLLAAAGPGGAGVLVSAHLEAPDLLALTNGPQSAFHRWPAARRRACLEALGRALRRMHDAEVSHRDLKPSNLLVVGGPGGGFRFPLVDLEGARPRFRAIRWPRRARDLARLAASLPVARADRLRALAAYHRVLPRPPWSQRRLATRVHARAEAHRRRLRTRYGAGSAPG
jgi:tRNA A-37 threonylcarbamoyl transferase component Bud32